jgi:hypothetical protein
MRVCKTNVFESVILALLISFYFLTKNITFKVGNLTYHYVILTRINYFSALHGIFSVSMP